jgi:hypothetical protein
MRTFLEKLFKRQDLNQKDHSEVLDDLMRISRLVGEYWLSDLDVGGSLVDSGRIEEGVNLMLEGFRPYLYPDAFKELVKKPVQ